jgi:hypothetical protein
MVVVLREPSVHLRSFDAGLKGNLSTAVLDSSTPATPDGVGTMSAQAAKEIIIARLQSLNDRLASQACSGSIRKTESAYSRRIAEFSSELGRAAARK